MARSKDPIVAMFDKTYETWFVGSGSDCCVYPLEEARRLLRDNYGLSLDETILFCRDTSFWGNKNQGLIITNKGIYICPDNDDMSQQFSINWSEFDSVRYQEQNLYFYKGSEMQFGGGLSIAYFYKGTDIAFSNRGSKLASALTQMASLVATDENPVEVASNGDYDRAIAIARDHVAADPNSWNQFCLGRVLYLKEGNKDNYDDIDNAALEEAVKALDKALDLLDPKDDNYANSSSVIIRNIGYVKQMQGSIYQARNAFIRALDGCDSDDADNLMELVRLVEEEDLKEVWDTYTETYDYKERKFIMPIKDCDIAGCVADGIDVFRLSNIPSCMHFPMGHPVPSQLYIGHPYNPSLYVPFDESEEIFFLDKIHELRYLLECLGAEEIAITSIKGKSVNEMNDASMQMSGGSDIKLFSGDGSRATGVKGQQETSKKDERTIRVRLDPTHAPYLPDGLIWYAEQPQWQRLVESRLHSNLLEYSEFVSSSQTKFTTKSETNDIKASFQYLWLKVHGEQSGSVESQFRESEETQWKVEVKFRSLKDFGKSKETTPALTEEHPAAVTGAELDENEQSYADEVKFCLEDGEIGDKERRFLNRMRDKLGISEQRAAEIEASLSAPSLTDDEQEYLDAVREEIEDGVIPERSQRLLRRLRMSMDIPVNRAQELEAMALGH